MLLSLVSVFSNYAHKKLNIKWLHNISQHRCIIDITTHLTISGISTVYYYNPAGCTKHKTKIAQNIIQKKTLNSSLKSILWTGMWTTFKFFFLRYPICIFQSSCNSLITWLISAHMLDSPQCLNQTICWPTYPFILTTSLLKAFLYYSG